MTFQDAIRICLTQKFARFDGRARRSEFWFFALFSAIVRGVANVLDGLMHIGNARTGGIISTLVSLALLIPTLAVGARRLHDTGRSGWWWLLALIPIVGVIILIVWWAQDSRADNQYGPNPKGYGQGYELGYGQGYPGQGYPGEGHPPGYGQGYPGEGHPEQAYPGQQDYPEQQAYPGQQNYPGQQDYPGQPDEPRPDSRQPYPPPPPPPPPREADPEERPPWGPPPR